MMTGRYHGSVARSLGYSFLRPIGKRVEELARGFKGKLERETVPLEVTALLDQATALIAKEEWGAALESARHAAVLVEDTRNEVARRAVGVVLVRLGDCQRGLRLSAVSVRLAGGGPPEWAGEDLAGRTLAVVQRTDEDMGGPIRMARFIAEAVRRAGHCVVIVEYRLVPLFQRNFPTADVRPIRQWHAVDAAGADFVTSFETLAGACVTDWQSMAATYVPLCADPDQKAQFARIYRAAAGEPVVGLSWGSKNGRKDMPDLASWATFVATFPATFVSMQYGPIAAAVRQLRNGRSDKLIWDKSVDQMVDMDCFAAQVASFDAVISISNTAAHLAGALDVPTVVIREDRSAGLYPLTGSGSGWYPRMELLRRRGRDWNVVMAEAAESLRKALGSR